MNLTVIEEGRVSHVAATMNGNRIRLPAEALQTALGWELKPQGLCKDDRCIPISGRADVVNDDGVDLAVFADLLLRPLALDADERVVCLGAAAAERAAQLASLSAPDFTLPDYLGKQHSLSDYRGKKVLLVAYASW